MASLGGESEGQSCAIYRDEGSSPKNCKQARQGKGYLREAGLEEQGEER